MNAYMNIQVRVLSAGAAAQIRALQAQINGLNGAMAAGSAMGMLGGARQIGALSKFGNQLQWTGRQLQYNFTLPLVIAGAAATNFALENERAFTRISKVYGDTTLSADVMKNELEALRKAFVALSNHYGVHQKQVLEIAADWAAAGASGVALARGVEQTLRVMVLGEMEAAAATEALIAIQAQYNLSSAQLVDTIAKLNVVENQTAISMQGLVQGFQRAAGVARSAGVDVDHLAAMLAALVPAAGTAAQAGNALKTILSRLMSPTARASEVMKEMGINLQSTAWQSANGAQRLEILAKKFHGLADSQRAVVSETIASRYQINKFEILMDQIYKGLNPLTQGQSRYAQALNATANRSKYLAQAEKELRAVLESNPQKLQQIWVILQNAMAEIIIPMIPVILMAAKGLANLAEAFRDLPPELQKAITFGLLFLALFGPLLRYIGSTMTLIGELTWFFGGLAGAIFGAVKAVGALLLMPFSALAGAIGSLAGGLLRFSGAAFAAARAAAVFLFTGPLFGRFFATIGALFTRAGSLILTIWIGALSRMAAVTGPMLMAITRLFGMWQVGMITVMTLVRNAMLAGWLMLVASSRFVGPAIIASFRVMWGALIAMTIAGRTALVAGFARMWALIIALTANWRVVLVRMVTMAWAGLLLVFRQGFAILLRYVMAGLAALIGPWGIAIAAIIAVLYAFRDQIGQLIQNIIAFFSNMPAGIAAAFAPIVNVFHAAIAAVQRGFNALPAGVRNALIAVVNIVAAAARQVYELFSYLNPFARHSPSLVENVTNGMTEIIRQFGRLTSIEGSIKAAYRELKAFGEATKGLLKGFDTAQRAEQRSNLAKVAPGALDEFDALVARLKQLNAILSNLKTKIDQQQSVVDAWKARLDKANDALEVQEKRLEALQKVLDAAKDRLQAAQDALQDYANTPIKGMKAFEDQIFANEMAQKRLRLEMLKMEQAGESMQDLQKRAEALAGQIEFLTGEQTALRDAGAGSEILKVYDDQIKGIEKQQDAIGEQRTEYQKLSSELEKLQKQAEIMDLEKSLKFDELKRQIDDAANSVKELSFEEIMAGIQKSNAEIAKYSAEVEKANKAVDDQKKVVDQATAARDAISNRLDAETKKLDALKDQYDKVNDAIQAINSSLQEMASAASDAIQKAEAAKKKGAGAGGALGGAGNFPEVGGAGGLGREGGLGDQSSLIDQFTKDLATKTGDLLGGFDLFGPIKTKFNQLKDWFSANVGPVFGAIGQGAKTIFSGIDWLAPFKDADWSWAVSIWDTFKDIVKTVIDWVKNIIKLFADDAKEIWNTIRDAFMKAWNDLVPELAKFKDLLPGIAEMWKNIWTVLKPVVAILGGALMLAIKVIVSILVNVLKPIINAIIDVFKGLIQIIRGVIEVVVGVFTGDWEMAWNGVKDIFIGIWNTIWGLLKGIVGTIWGIIKGFVEGIVDFFVWLWDVLVGHSIVPDMINAIIDWFASLPGKVWNAIKMLGSKIIEVVSKAWDMWKEANSKAWNTITTWFLGLAVKVYNAISDIKNKLKAGATQAMTWFKDGFNAIWNSNVVTWLRTRPQAAADAINNIKNTLKNVATTAINWFRDGASNAWTNVRNFLTGRASAVKNAIGNISLFSVGKAIFKSLWDGLKAMWNEIEGWLGGVGDKIKNVKGPIEKDRKLLIPEGKAIMQSLGIGLEGEWPTVSSYLKTVAPAMRDALIAGMPTATPTALKSLPMDRLAGSLVGTDARLSRATTGTDTLSSGNNYGTRIENHFHGELVFPNVKDGSDAEEFILNLEALITGGS